MQPNNLTEYQGLADPARCGIYRIMHQVSGTAYIGSSIDMPGRLRGHAKDLRRGTHGNRHLQAAWNKYGKQAFMLEQLVICPPKFLVEREQQFMDAYIAHGLRLYNQQPSARSNQNFRKHISQSTREKIRIATLNNYQRRPELIEQLRTAHTGLKASEETKAKMSAAKKGRPHTPSWNANVSAALKARGIRPTPSTAERRAKTSATQKGRTLTSEHREKLRIAALKRYGRIL